MSDDNGHVYEAKIWEVDGGGWKVKVLRDGVTWSMERNFTTYDECLAWARSEANESRLSNIAESKAERVEV